MTSSRLASARVCLDQRALAATVESRSSQRVTGRGMYISSERAKARVDLAARVRSSRPCSSASRSPRRKTSRSVANCQIRSENPSSWSFRPDRVIRGFADPQGPHPSIRDGRSSSCRGRGPMTVFRAPVPERIPRSSGNNTARLPPAPGSVRSCPLVQYVPPPPEDPRPLPGFGNPCPRQARLDKQPRPWLHRNGLGLALVCPRTIEPLAQATSRAQSCGGYALVRNAAPRALPNRQKSFSAHPRPRTQSSREHLCGRINAITRGPGAVSERKGHPGGRREPLISDWITGSQGSPGTSVRREGGNNAL